MSTTQRHGLTEGGALDSKRILTGSTRSEWAMSATRSSARLLIATFLRFATSRSAGLVVNSPIEAPVLIKEVKRDWGDIDANEHMASLLADARAGKDLWGYGPALAASPVLLSRRSCSSAGGGSAEKKRSEILSQVRRNKNRRSNKSLQPRAQAPGKRGSRTSGIAPSGPRRLILKSWPQGPMLIPGG